MAEITTDEIRNFLKPLEGQKVTLDEVRREFNILQGSKSYNIVRVIMNRLVDQKILKATGVRGEFRVLKEIKTVDWWDGSDPEPITFRFPRSYTDGTKFDIENCVEIFEGDMILLDGVTNAGKTAIAISIMGENLDLFGGCLLMGSEHTKTDGNVDPKFKRRLNRMEWANWINDGHPKFDLLPVGSDYEDYVRMDALNIIDWISLPGDFWLIDTILKKIKDNVGKGVVVPVLQKNSLADYAEGGERAERYADLRLTINPYGDYESRLTISRVKAPKGRAKGRTWAFMVVDNGANLKSIREIVRCSKCYGKGWKQGSPCWDCKQRGYVDHDI